MLLRTLAIALAVAVVAAACTIQGDVPPLERRAQQLNKVIMCPVCPGESIDQSQNPLALQMRGIVDDLLSQGLTEGQIKDFFVERYGPSVLLEPPRRGFSLMVWVVPPVGVVAAGLALLMALRLMRRTTLSQAGGEERVVQAPDPELAYYLRRIEAALGYREDVVANPGRGEGPRSKGKGAGC